MASMLMIKIDRALMTMELHDLAELYCRAHDHERGAVDTLARVFYGVLRRHIALAVQTKLESEESDE